MSWLTTERLALILSTTVAVVTVLTPLLTKVIDRSMLHESKAADWRGKWWERRCGIYERILAEATTMTQRVWNAADAGDMEAIGAAREDMVRVADSELRAAANAYASSRCAQLLATLLQQGRPMDGDTPQDVERRVDKAYADLCIRVRRELMEGPRRAGV